MMKRWLLALISMMVFLGLTSCALAPQGEQPKTSEPEETFDLAYDMQNFDFLSDIFEEKTVDEWKSLGRYTMLLNGLHTPVVVTMDGTDVLAVGAFGQTVELGAAGLADDYHEGYSPVYDIDATPDIVVIKVSGGEGADTSILITKERHYTFGQETGYEISFSIRENGTMKFYRTWNVMDDLEEMGCEALGTLTSRDEPLYETGRAEVVDRALVLTAEETVTVSDEFDLDALFAQAKEAGMFEQHETLDALLAANQAVR